MIDNFPQAKAFLEAEWQSFLSRRESDIPLGMYFVSGPVTSTNGLFRLHSSLMGAIDSASISKKTKVSVVGNEGACRIIIDDR